VSRTPCDPATGNRLHLPAAPSNHATVEAGSVAQRARARKGEWEQAYFAALSRGHVKASAAGIAGVSERCVYKRAKEDPDFAEREWIAYHLGTAALMKIALDRVRDPVRPSDSILIHLLAVREVDHKRVREHGAPPRAMEAQHTIPMDKLSLETKRRIVAELEAIERETVR
jgi:hypothetical protein